MSSTFPERLVYLQTSRKLLKKDIASAVGISVMAYYRYEKGVRHPDLPLIIAFAEYFNVSLDYIAGLSDSPEKRL